MRSAFGLGGQKCSANSRVYVESSVHDEFVRLLVEKTKALKVGDPRVRGIIDQMGRQATNQPRLALDAYADVDPSWARALADMDDAMDELTKSLFRYVLSLAPADEAAVQQAVQISLVGRHYERIADHAVTIAERVVFMVTGEYPVHEADRPEVAGEVG